MVQEFLSKQTINGLLPKILAAAFWTDIEPIFCIHQISIAKFHDKNHRNLKHGPTKKALEEDAQPLPHLLDGSCGGTACLAVHRTDANAMPKFTLAAWVSSWDAIGMPCNR